MPKQIQLRRGTTTQHATFTGAGGEVTMDIRVSDNPAARIAAQEIAERVQRAEQARPVAAAAPTAPAPTPGCPTGNSVVPVPATSLGGPTKDQQEQAICFCWFFCWFPLVPLLVFVPPFPPCSPCSTGTPRKGRRCKIPNKNGPETLVSGPKIGCGDRI